MGRQIVSRSPHPKASTATLTGRFVLSKGILAKKFGPKRRGFAAMIPTMMSMLMVDVVTRRSRRRPCVYELIDEKK